jgi:hypothetical protein
MTVALEVAGHTFKCRESVSLSALRDFAGVAAVIRAAESRAIRAGTPVPKRVLTRQVALVAEFVRLVLPTDEQERFQVALAVHGAAIEAELVNAIARSFDELLQREEAAADG